MRDISAVFKRLQNIIPSGVSPKFTSAEDLMAWHLEEGRRYSEKLMRENHHTCMKKIFGRSGICKRYGIRYSYLGLIVGIFKWIVKKWSSLLNYSKCISAVHTAKFKKTCYFL